MTQEEIALQHGLCNCDKIYTSRGLKAPDCPWHAFPVEEAMDTYARQEAIEFQNWIRDNTVADGAPKLLHTTGRKTTEELYDLYLTYKNKTDG